MEENTNNQIQQSATQSQFQISPVPFHTHTGVDSPLITTVSLPQGTPVKLGAGAIISFNNPGVTPGSAGEEITTAIVAGKDTAGNTGITTENLQVMLEHYPQNASNYSYFDAARPPFWTNIPNTTISVASGANTVTLSGYGFATNELANSYIDIFDNTGALIETQTIVSNTDSVITISGTWLHTTNGGSFIIFSPVFLGRTQFPWRRVYVMEGSTEGGVRFGVGPTNAGQNGLLYTDSSGNLNYRNYAGSVSALGGGGGVNGRSHGTGITSIPANTPTKLTPTVNDFANGITWDATNHKFTIVTAGQYLVIACITWSSGPGSMNGKDFETRIYKNGSEVTLAIQQGVNANDSITVTSSDMFDCVIGDYFEIYAFQDSAITQGIANSNETAYLSIAKV